MQEQTYTREQHALIAELSTTYGIEPEEVIFFKDDPRPLFAYEAGCVLVNVLTDIRGIDMEPVSAGFVDSISHRCVLTRPDGATRSAIGVANLKETDAAGKQLNTAQVEELSRSRAFRNALRVAGIDLLKLHNRRVAFTKGGMAFINATIDAVQLVPKFAGPPLSLKENLLRRVHALGVEAGLIVGDDKQAWATIMSNRFDGIRHSNELDEKQLEEFAALLETLVPRTGQKAA